MSYKLQTYISDKQLASFMLQIVTTHYMLCTENFAIWYLFTTLNQITDFLKYRTQRVAVDGHSSDLSKVMSGVPQGTVLAPLLFICHVSDTALLAKLKIRLYADDILAIQL